MKRIHWIVTVAVTVFVLSLNAVAQPPGGGPPGGGPPRGMGPGGGMGPMGGMGNIGAMFQNPQNQEAFAKELELTPEQATDLPRVVREAVERARREFENTPRPQQGASPEEMRQFGDTMRQRMEAGMTEVQANIDRILKPEQRTKLRDVTFQLSGGLNSPMLGMPMGERALVETLGLTDAQKEQFRKLAEDRNTAMREMMERFRQEGVDPRSAEGQTKIRAESEQLTTKFAEQVKGILTPEQKAKVENLTAAAPDLRKRLGIPEPGQPPQRGQQRQGQPAPGGGFVPGQGAWQPGQSAPNAPPGGQQRQRGGFPRGEN